mmetsp:Transcript_39722/g.64433  ORF Transcript_39722/g.64433 Transcript_39722/m.64433 type:complete len:270 (+) Transcript_39722:42-851(+)
MAESGFSDARGLRAACRSNKWRTQTSGLCPGFLQTNLVILPKEYANDFKRFCELNKEPCPLVAILPPGQVEPSNLAKGADVRTDLPMYNVYSKGQLIEQVPDIKHLFRDDMVSFFLGCSFSFERALQEAGVPVRNIDEGRNVSMYITNRPCIRSGPFHCDLVVTMRPVAPEKVELATEITTKLTSAHGSPVHIGNPQEIGIQDLNKVDFGDAVTVHPGEIPVFWACGVTAITSAISAKSDIVITHSPGHMFVADVPDTYLPEPSILNVL